MNLDLFWVPFADTSIADSPHYSTYPNSLANFSAITLNPDPVSSCHSSQTFPCSSAEGFSVSSRHDVSSILLEGLPAVSFEFQLLV
ncbi:hypothetical protein AYI69_g1243 [Smittium culicis]|uniref:Uncharacterized protein n=1 Tax=Smittium culicis TaxID=133412 RepID=A0A1R1YQT1_9FUNG|nr:hypothetical protein AYI69_g1243 [Smittium culicis]